MLRSSDRFYLGLLIAAAFGMDLTFRAGAQAYQEAGLSFKASALQLGLLGTFSAFCYSLMCLLSGRISDRIGRRPSTLIACAGLAVAYFLAARASHTYQLLALTPLSGSSLAFFWPATQAWIADLSGRGHKALARHLGWFNVSWSAGLMVGPAFTGYLWSYGSKPELSQHMVFRTVAGMAVLLAGVMTIIRARPIASVTPSGENDVEQQAHPLAASLLLGARAGTFASWFAVGVIGSLFPKLADTLGFDERLRGILAACYHAGQCGLFIAVLFGTRWHFRRWPLAVAEACALIGMVSVVWARRPVHFALAFIVMGICSGVAYTASLFHSLHGRTGGRGKLAGMHEAILASGIFLSPLIGGLLAQHVSLRAPFVLVGVVLAGAIVLQLIVWRSGKRAHRARIAAPD